MLISLTDDEYWLDLRGTNFGDLIGFEKKIVSTTEYATKLPNITNSIDVLNINTSAKKDCIVSRVNTKTIDTIPTDNLTRSRPFTYEPKRPWFSPVSPYNIAEIWFYITDSIRRRLNLNGIDWYEKNYYLPERNVM